MKCAILRPTANGTQVIKFEDPVTCNAAEQSGDTVIYYGYEYDLAAETIANTAGVTRKFLGDAKFTTTNVGGTFGGIPTGTTINDLTAVAVDCAIASVPIAFPADLVKASDGKVYKKNSGGTAWEDFSFDISAEDITHTALLAKIAASTLIPGTYYKITDYASVHTIPNTTDTNTPTAEPLIVLAIAVNKLSPIAFSPAFPQDIIYYEVTNDQAMVPGCTKGYISRRIDTKNNNDIGCDFRNVKFRRWQIEVTAEDATGAVANYTKGQVVKKTGTVEIYIKLNNTTAKLFTSTADWKRFEWDNLMYVSKSATTWAFGGGPYSVSIPCSALYMDYKMFTTAPTAAGVESAYTTIYNNKIGQNLSSIIANISSVIFGATCYSNTIGNNFHSNSIGNNFYSNSIRNSFNSNSIGTAFQMNTIGDTFQINTIGNSFINNTIGYDFKNNTIGLAFTNNRIGIAFSYNLIGNSFGNNTIGDSFMSIMLGNAFALNTIGNGYVSSTDLSAATIIYGSYPKWWFITPNGTKQLYYFANTTFALTLSDITA